MNEELIKAGFIIVALLVAFPTIAAALFQSIFTALLVGLGAAVLFGGILIWLAVRTPHR